MELTFTLRQTMISSGNMLTTIILISYSTPVFLAVVVPLGILYRLAQVTRTLVFVGFFSCFISAPVFAIVHSFLLFFNRLHELNAVWLCLNLFCHKFINSIDCKK